MKGQRSPWRSAFGLFLAAGVVAAGGTGFLLARYQPSITSNTLSPGNGDAGLNMALDFTTPVHITDFRSGEDEGPSPEAVSEPAVQQANLTDAPAERSEDPLANLYSEDAGR